MLEEAIKENTAVLRELLARLSNGDSVLAAPATPKQAAAEVKVEKAAEKAADKAAEKIVTGKVLNYDTDIKPVALALAKKNRPALTAIWAEFKVKVGSELKPEQFEAALAAIVKASA